MFVPLLAFVPVLMLPSACACAKPLPSLFFAFLPVLSCVPTTCMLPPVPRRTPTLCLHLPCACVAADADACQCSCVCMHLGQRCADDPYKQHNERFDLVPVIRHCNIDVQHLLGHITFTHVWYLHQHV